MRHLHAIAITSALGLAACATGSSNRPDSSQPDPLATAPAQLLLERGRAFDAAGDTIRAEQYLVAAANRGAPADEVLPLLLSTCIRGQRFRAALGHAERYLARRPEDRALLQLSAVLYLATGAPEKARISIERVIASGPVDPEAHYLLARSLDELGQPSKAEPELRRYLALAPEGPRAREAKEWLDAHRATRRSRRGKR